MFSGWRDELYPVTAAFDSPPALLLERAAAPFFGIRAYGVHVNGYVVAADGSKELLDNQLLTCERSKASANVARMLDIRTGSAVISVNRLLVFSGKPLILDRIVLPAAPFKGVTADKINAFNGSMYRMYETQLGIRMVRAEERLTAVGADAEVASILGLRLGTPLLSIERVSYTYGDKPMEWRLGLCLTEDHHYLNHLE